MYFRATWRTFQPKLKKIKTIHPEKNSWYFRKWNLFVLILKKFRKRRPWKKIPYISGNGNPKIISYILGNGTFQSTLRKFLIFQKTETPKKLLIFSQKKAVIIYYETETPKKSLYFRKWNFLIFQETELSYTSGSRTFLYCGKVILRTLEYLEIEAYLEPWRI